MARLRIPLPWVAAVLLLAALPFVPARAADASDAKPDPVRRLGPLMTEMRALLEDERASLLSLNQRLAAARGHAAALEVQREIARVKLSTEVALIRAQAKHARAAGHTAFADELETAAQTLESPPAARPASTSTTDNR